VANSALPHPPRRTALAVTGLLVVVLLLAVSLVVTAVLSYRASRAAADAVLLSRAVEVAASLRAAARFSSAEDGDTLQTLIKELATEEIGLHVTRAGGRVVAGAGGPAPLQIGERVDRRVVRAIQADGQVQRVANGPRGEYLEYWQPVGGPPRPGRGWRWRSKRWPGFGPKLGPGPGFPRAGGRRPTLLRVTVDHSVADDVLAPARNTLAVSGTSAGVLLVLGLMLYAGARRARRMDQELQRRRALTALGEMAAVLAHEIRTPLGSIKGNAQLIGEAHPSDERAAAVVREAGRLERLVNGLLDYARPATPRRVPTNPDEVADRAAEIVLAKAGAAGVNLLTDPAQQGECLQADPDQLVQVLVNLLQNAVEASSDGQNVVLRVRRSRGQVSFAVLDSGEGLGDEDLEQLLRPFYSTKRAGTGLGLSVARQIVEQHGGRLRMERRPGGGVLAEATLPEKGGILP